MAYNRKDSAYLRAKREGFRSRAAYKLGELDDHFRLLRPGQRVVDLGCWPGSWLQVAASRVGPSGLVVGIDRVETTGLGGGNVRILQLDIAEEQTVALVQQALGGPADVVVSDLAPKLTGIRNTDAARHAELVRAALAAAAAWLRPGGAILVKLFMSEEYPALVQEIRSRFSEVRTRKPDSTRQGSAEIYVCGRGFRARRPGDV